jgi:hypothetical protein
MNITNKELMDISLSLNYLSSMDTEAWYQVSRNIKRIESPLNELNEARDTIIKKFIQKDDKGFPVFIDEAKTQYDLGKNSEKADSLWHDLQKEIIDVDFYTFKYDLLKNTKLNAIKIAPLLDTVIVE